MYHSVSELCSLAKTAAPALAALDSATKNAALLGVADALLAHEKEILAANELDVQAGREQGLDAALIDRLTLNRARLEAIAAAVRDIVALRDPVGEVIAGWRQPNGLEIRQTRVPLGVIAVVYEARPNVTIDAAALCLKAGNAVVLRGSSTAKHSNRVLADLFMNAAQNAGIPKGAIGLAPGANRDELRELATQEGVVDLIIPRGGEGLKNALREVATVPVIYAASGNCHVYVDSEVNLTQAQAIIYNAKVQRPGVCNAAETLLVHADVAGEFLQSALTELADNGVELRGCQKTRTLAGDSLADKILPADEEDWKTEYLALKLAVKVVDSFAEALEHITRYGSGHSEAIVTESVQNAKQFTRRIDAACVYVNASTRFTDGGEFGMGAEIGNSTQKLHARGPIALRELCTYRYIIEGDGHVRPG